MEETRHDIEHTVSARGLTTAEAQARLAEVGENAIEENLVTSCEVGFFFAYEQNVYANNRALYNGVNYDGRVPTGAYDGGGNIGIGTFVGGNIGSQLQLKAQPRLLKRVSKK